MYDKEFKNYMDSGQFPLKIMFGNKFNDLDENIIIENYLNIVELYVKELESLFFNDLKRISLTPTKGRYWNFDFNYEINKFENLKSLKFETDYYNKIKQEDMMLELIHYQMASNIINSEKEGKNVEKIKENIRMYLDDIKTNETVKVYKELFVEANTQLGLFKLDSKFKDFKYKVEDVINKEFKESNEGLDFQTVKI